MDEAKSFGAEWDEEMELAVAACEDELKRRACDRDDKHSHLLLMFFLKAMKPERYRDNRKAQARGATTAQSLAEALKTIEEAEI